ncbi:hypothetical protein QR680_010703 [Steinernema hermaphroditum]|uniref:Uncharacterized protein n=1 Tax=Steinernema hermaphroditum TaxID=289476 RepID=A0AA39MC87_9BILA|nr:hypothetical protein QR680_010703 [Steinernema hermaphroditum]
MDCVPYKFCEEVIGSLDMTKSNWEDDAKELSGLWRIAAEKYAENLCILEIAVWKDQGKWQCNIERNWEMPEDMKLPKSMGELLAMDRRFIRIGEVIFGRDADRPINGTVITISNKELVEKLIPFLNAQSFSSCTHRYTMQAICQLQSSIHDVLWPTLRRLLGSSQRRTTPDSTFWCLVKGCTGHTQKK